MILLFKNRKSQERYSGVEWGSFNFIQRGFMATGLSLTGHFRIFKGVHSFKIKLFRFYLDFSATISPYFYYNVIDKNLINFLIHCRNKFIIQIFNKLMIYFPYKLINCSINQFPDKKLNYFNEWVKYLSARFHFKKPKHLKNSLPF